MKILVVEDDVDINKVLTDILRVANYTVVSAFSGSEAMLNLKAETFDLILLDLMLPGVMGEEIITKVRQKNDIPIIVISAKVEDNLTATVLRRGADDFISKPFDVDEVLARIESVTRRTVKISKIDDTIKFKEITIHPASRDVYINDNLLTLTASEYDILKLFVENPTKVFSRDNIFSSVWDADSFFDDNTITVHVSNFRHKKKKTHPEHEYIKTVWGIGYRLEQ